MKWITISQTIAFVAGSVIIPFYIVVLQEASNSYSLFAYIYATFTISATIAHSFSGFLLNKVSCRSVLVTSNLLSAVALFLIPSSSDPWHFIIIQIILGTSISLQKSAEKVAVAKETENKNRSTLIGNYHAFGSIVTGISFLLLGWFLNTFSLVFLFYLISFWFFVASIISIKIKV